MFPDDIVALANAVLDAARRQGVTIATAESCTAGLVSGALTTISGSADVVERGFVTYSNAAKQEMLGVDARLIDGDGAVSETVARAMAQGALKHAHADLAVAITGIAGPTGGTADKPVGLVHFAVARKGGQTTHRRELFAGMDREGVRLASVRVALKLLLERLAGRSG